MFIQVCHKTIVLSFCYIICFFFLKKFGLPVVYMNLIKGLEQKDLVFLAVMGPAIRCNPYLPNTGT